MKLYDEIIVIIGKGSIGFLILFLAYAINVSGLLGGLNIGITYLLVLLLIGSVISLMQSLVKKYLKKR